MDFLVSPADLTALFQVIVVDLVLAGDNAIVIALVVAGFPPKERARLLMLGIVAATVVRVLFALVASQLLQIVGLMLAGGILLLWVCWKLWRELETQRSLRSAAEATGSEADVAAFDEATHSPASTDHPKSLRDAVTQIVIADVSMSLDNVLAVAGIAREKSWILIFGLVLSIAFMAFASTFIARMLQRYHWIGYIGLAIIVWVSIKLIWDGAIDVMPAISAAIATAPTVG